MTSLSLYNPTVKSSELRHDLVMVKGFDVKNTKVIKELEAYITIEREQVFREKNGFEFSIVIKNNAEEINILNPLDFLDIDLMDNKGHIVSLPKSPSKYRINTGGADYDHLPIFDVMKASVDNKKIQDIKGLKNIVLHKESKLEISLRYLKVRKKDETEKDARKIISNAVDILPGKYTMSIVLSILNSTGSRKFLRSHAIEIDLL